MINYNHYRMFCWVAETESMSRAAEIVGVTDSAVSHTIRALESQLGGKLFLRTPAKTLKLTLLGILLTPNGDASDLKTTPVAPVREVFIAHRSLLNTAKTHPISILKEHPFVCLPHDSSSFLIYSEHFERHGLIGLIPDIEVRQMNLIANLVQKKMGIGVIFDFMLRPFAARYPDIRLLTVDAPLPQRQIAIVEPAEGALLEPDLIETLHEKILSALEKLSG